MATTTTSTASPAQSIGEENGQPVDGIAGTHAGNQEPAGADVNAGASQARKEVEKPNRSGAQPNQTVYPSNQRFNGSVMRGGKAVGVYTGCGSLSRR